MNLTTSQPRPGPASLAHRRRACGRGENALTTLEWLLVVAAVAGLAALAVVLVTNIVDDTAERLADVNSRQVAYDLATTELAERWTAETPTTNEEAQRINRDYTQDCRQLGIVYADVGRTLFVKPGTYQHPTPGWQHPPICSLT